MKIVYLKHKLIDKRKWDLCIKNSFNGIIYAYSWYLDIVSENWDALVEGDYETVMPLTKNQKYKIQYLRQPSFAQQLGVFSTSRLDKNKVETFLKAIPKEFKYVEINLNIYNRLENSGLKTKNNTNYELDLIKPYEKLQKSFSTNTKRNIAKAHKSNISIVEGVTSNDLITLFKNNVGDTRNNFSSGHYDTLRRLISFCTRFRFGEIIGAYTAENNLCAATLFVYSNQKGIYLVSVSTPEGIEKRAMFCLIDHYIQKNSERNMTLDFEGSNIESIARFFKGFGATACEYQSISINRLPWPLRWMKKGSY
ncbi:MAG: hypothetical protein K9H64_00500 [Bacteroidales bacterium]|nr:hypothetical protein [Bacteroidales bacterium]MCF8454372.1 hypothetical protein [Bacteroidales bacterium]